MTNAQYNFKVSIAMILLSYLKPSSRRTKPLPYTSLYVPEISLSKYIDRICRYASLHEDALICALIYIDRYLLASRVDLTAHEIHRLFLIAAVSASKFLNDDFFENRYYAEIGGISINEFNFLEIDFMETINYSLYVDKDLYSRYSRAVCSYRNMRSKS